MGLCRVIFVALAIGAAPSAAAAADTTQVWPTAFVTLPLGDKFISSGEVIGRAPLEDDRASQLELRFQVGRPISPRLTLWVGYVRVITYQPSGSDGLENQAVEQLNWAGGKIGAFSISSRTRLEQRFLRGADGVSMRLREQVRALAPLGRSKVSAVLWAEPFISVYRTNVARKTFDQLRLFAGLTLPLSKEVDAEFGYLRQHLHRSGGDIENNAFPFVLNVRL